MKAIALTRYLPISNPESLMDVEIDKPAPAGRDLLVKIEAIGVNPVDTKVRAPKDKVEETPRVLGWDASGVVEAVGPDVTLFKVETPSFMPAASRGRVRTVSSIWSMSASLASSPNRSISRTPRPCRSPRSLRGKHCSRGSGYRRKEMTPASPC